MQLLLNIFVITNVAGAACWKHTHTDTDIDTDADTDKDEESIYDLAMPAHDMHDSSVAQSMAERTRVACVEHHAFNL